MGQDQSQLEVTPGCLVQFNALKEGFEVARTETLVVVSLDNFNENSWSILQRLREDLKKIPIVVIVDQNLQSLDRINVFLHLDWGLCQPLSEHIVVAVWNVEELHASCSQIINGGDDVKRPDGNMLNPCASIVVDVLLDLRFLLPWSWFVDWHLDCFFVVCYNNATQGRVVRVHLLIINRPESMEKQVVLIPLCGILHGEIRLVANDVIDEVKSIGRQCWRENVLVVGNLIARQEESVVVLPFNKSMSCVAVRLHSGESHFPSFILLRPYLLHYFHLRSILSSSLSLIFYDIDKRTRPPTDIR